MNWFKLEAHFLLHALLQGSTMRQQPWVQSRGSAPLLCNLWGGRIQNPTAVLRHQWGWPVPKQNLASGGCIWQIYNFSCVMSMCSQPRLSGLLLAVLYVETSLHTAYRLSSAFWKPLCMNGLSAHLEMSLIDTKTQEKLHPRCFCYDLVVFSVNTWHL